MNSDLGRTTVCAKTLTLSRRRTRLVDVLERTAALNTQNRVITTTGLQ